MTIIDIYDNYGNVIDENNYKNIIKYPISSVLNDKINKFEWIFQDINIINEMKNANVSESFESKCFEMYRFDKWKGY